MAVDFESAISAYRQAASSVESAMENKPAVAPASGDNSFTNMVTDSLKGAAEVGYQAEELTLKKKHALFHTWMERLMFSWTAKTTNNTI